MLYHLNLNFTIHWQFSRLMLIDLLYKNYRDNSNSNYPSAQFDHSNFIHHYFCQLLTYVIIDIYLNLGNDYLKFIRRLYLYEYQIQFNLIRFQIKTQSLFENEVLILIFT